MKRAELEAEEGRWLLRAFRAGTHAHFGFASFWEYIERLLGLGRRATEEKLRVAGALEGLPALAEALQSGELTWSAVREVTRVAVPETEREWLAVALGKTARELERWVSGLAPGDRPNARRRPEFVRHVLRFEVGAETLAAFREAITAVQKRSDHRLTDDEALLTMAREILGGPGDVGRASYQVVVTQCEDCGRGFQHANGELVALDPAIVDLCLCDAQHVTISKARETSRFAATDARAAGELDRNDAHADAIGGSDRNDAHVDADGEFDRNDAHVDAVAGLDRHDAHVDAVGGLDRKDAHVDAVGEFDGNRAHGDAAGGRARNDAHVDAVGEFDGNRAHADAVAGLDRHDAEADAVGGLDRNRAHTDAVGEFDGKRAHVDADGGRDRNDAHVDAIGEFDRNRAHAGAVGDRARRRRATQDTAPAVRREVFLRDRGRCVVPGCRNASYVDLHHLDLRSEGGSNDPDNLVMLCGAHHGAVHRGRLQIDGRVSNKIRFRHADGTAYGFMPSPMLAEASAQAFVALKNLGFPEKTARAALRAALASVPANATAETLLRSAVARAISY